MAPPVFEAGMAYGEDLGSLKPGKAIGWNNSKGKSLSLCLSGWVFNACNWFCVQNCKHICGI